MRTSQIVWLGKALLKSAVSFVLLVFLFRLVDFSVWQSVTLAVLVELGYEAYQTVSARATAGESFSPFRVVVCPKFDELLLNYKLLKDVGEAKALHSLWEKKDQRLISFTVLELRPSGDWLIYSNTDNCFLSDIDLEEPIDAIAFRSVFEREESAPVFLIDPAAPENGLLHSRISPIYYFRQGVGGYELGLKVRDDWWKKICADNPTEEFSKMKVDTNHITGEAKLTIATIPHAAFALFHARRDHKQIEDIWKAMDSQLELYGWKRVQPDPDAEVSDPWIRIEHKYFRVQYREI